MVCAIHFGGCNALWFHLELALVPRSLALGPLNIAQALKPELQYPKMDDR